MLLSHIMLFLRPIVVWILLVIRCVVCPILVLVIRLIEAAPAPLLFLRVHLSRFVRPAQDILR